LEKNTLIDALVVELWSHYTMLQTYTCTKSGLRARMLESDMGDASISLWMVNKDTRITLSKFYYVRSHTRCNKVTIGLVLNVAVA
jgi:hypothetical protein